MSSQDLSYSGFSYTPPPTVYINRNDSSLKALSTVTPLTPVTSGNCDGSSNSAIADIEQGTKEVAQGVKEIAKGGILAFERLSHSKVFWIIVAVLVVIFALGGKRGK